MLQVLGAMFLLLSMIKVRFKNYQIKLSSIYRFTIVRGLISDDVILNIVVFATCLQDIDLILIN